MIKKSNSIIQNKLLSLKGGIDDLILTLGFVDVISFLVFKCYKQIDEEHYAFVGDYFTVLNRGSKRIESKLNKVKVKYMNDEEKKKYETIQEA